MSLPARSRIAAILSARSLPIWLAAIAAIVLAPSLGLGLVVDDYVIRAVEMGHARQVGVPTTPFDVFRFCDVADVPSLREHGAIPWWASPDLRVAFFRPLAAASHWLDHRLFPASPAAMHAVSIAWVAATVIVAAAIYRRLIGAGWTAGLAALLFTLDPGHAAAAGWIAARNAVLAAFFGLAALYAHDRWRRDGDRRAALAAPICCALSLTSGESGAATLALLFAHVVAFEGPRLAARARAIAPTAGVALAWVAVYRGLGYGAAHSNTYVDPITTPATYLHRAALGIPINLGARLGGLPASMAVFFAERSLPILALVGLAAIAAAVVATWPMRRDPAARFFAAGALLATLPIASTLPNDRNLFFVGFAASGLVALVVRRAVAERAVFVRVHAAWLCLLMIVVAIPAGLMNATSMNLFVKLSRDPLNRVLLDEAAKGTTVVFVNPPSPFFVSHLVPMRIDSGLPVPSRIRALAPGIYPIRLRRSGVDQVTLHVDGGVMPRPGTWPAGAGEAPALKMEYVAQHLSSFARGAREPMRVGEVVNLSGCRIDVDAAHPEGGPTEVRFTFDRPLDDPSLRWLAWSDGAYVPFPLPPVGGEVTLAPARITP